MDNELFELCNEVYKRTGWTTADWWSKDKSTVLTTGGKTDAVDCPIYDSDYLLEKLPQQVKHYYFELVPGPVEETDNGWIARYKEPIHDGQFTAAGSDTPLKALLRLAIALDDAGVKP